MRILVTRPEDDATALVRLLGERGIDAVIEPLLVIEHVAGAALDLEGVQALLMTSANGARACAAATKRRDLAVFAVGDATARAATEAGFRTIESAAGDVGALADLVRERLDPGAGGLVHVAASTVAGDLGGALRASGFAYRREILYRARQATAFSQATRSALRDQALDGALFFSPRTAQTFVSLVRDGRLCECCEVMVALCLSAAVADELAALPWRAVRIARRPDQGSLVALVDEDGREPHRRTSGRPLRRPGQDGMVKDSAKSEARSATRRKRSATGRAGTPAASADTQGPVQEPAARSPAAEASANTVPEAPPPPEKPSPPEAASGSSADSRPVALVAFLFAIVAVAVLAGAVYASAPFWIPRVTPYLPVALRDPFLDPRFTALASRIQSLEELARARAVYGNAIQDLEEERAVFSERLDDQLTRLDELDRALGTVKGLVTQVQGGADPEATRASLDRLRGRLNQLETMRDSVSARLAEMARTADSAPPAGGLAAVEELGAQNERLSTAVRDMAGRLDRLETAPVPAPDSDTVARALVLAVGQLREALRTSGAYADEVAAVKALVGGDREALGAVAVLEMTADSGIPTLEALSAEFGAVARRVVVESIDLGGEGWLNRAGKWFFSIVSVRRTGDGVGGAEPDAVVARAEVLLASGDLMAAVDALAALDGKGAEAAAEWRARARSRLAAERAMAKLHIHAISRVGAG